MTLSGNMCADVQRSNGMGFIRLHIPWSILSREAELQKIKVAVKKVSSFTQSVTYLGSSWFQFYLVQFEHFFEIFNLARELAVWKTVENDQVALIKMFFMCVVFM